MDTIITRTDLRTLIVVTSTAVGGAALAANTAPAGAAGTSVYTLHTAAAITNSDIERALCSLPAGFTKPSRGTIWNADRSLTSARTLAGQLVGRWEEPHVTPTPEGGISFEWWNDNHKLSWLFDETRSHYLRSWGADIFTEMDDGPIPDVGAAALSLRWLFSAA